MIKLIASVILVTSLTGCANFETGLSDAIDTAYIIEANDGITETVLKADLTTQERQVVLDAESSMLDLKAYLEGISTPSDIIMIDGVVSKTVERYDEAKAVALAHEQEYELYDWEGLVSFHAQMSAMYERYEQFQSQQKYQEAASQLGEYVKLGLKLAVIYGA